MSFSHPYLPVKDMYLSGLPIDVSLILARTLFEFWSALNIKDLFFNDYFY